MLVLDQFLCVLFTLRGIFMHFLELTINKMPQCQFLFSAVFLFQFLLKEIFSELDETKAKVPIYQT
jgi:hypothetical protein